MEAVRTRPRTMREIYQYLPEGVPVQLINNQLIMSPAPQDPHQQLVTDISFELTGYVRKNKLGKTRVAPSDVFLNDENIYQPDVYFVSNENSGRFERDGFHGAPDFVVEIISPGTEKLDRNEKMKVYESSGVKEYWLIDPDTKKATGYYNTNGKYELISEEQEKISSRLLNTVLHF